MGRGSYCKLYVGNTEVVNGSTQAGASFSNLLALDNTQQSQGHVQVQGPTHRVFRTKVLYTDQKSCPAWNEKLELHVLDPETEILTIRVKNQLMLFCPAVGACAIPLCHVTVGEPAEQWFPLHKGGKPAGHIRLQLLLKEKEPTTTPPPVAVTESPMQRLIQQHCQQERERRQSQVSHESLRRRQFEEQERIQVEMSRLQQQAEERERARIEELAKLQALREQIQREEQARVQAYLQKQMEQEQDWQTENVTEKLDGMKVEETPEDVTKETGTGSGYYFGDDTVTTSTSRCSSNASGLKQSFTSSNQDGSHREEVAEAHEISDVVLGEVVHDALPSSDSSDVEAVKKRNWKKTKERREQHSRKQSRNMKGNQLNSPPLFPRSPESELQKEISHRNLSSASHEDLSSSEESSSSEEERRRRRRRRREKRAKRKERRRRRKAKRKARRDSDGYESSSSYSSSSSSSSSSSTSSADEKYKSKTRKHNKTKERAHSQREGKASNTPRAPVPPHSKSYGPDHFSYSTNKFSEPPPAYARSVQPQNSRPGFIETLPPQPQQQRTMAEKISTAADVASILSDVASVATSIQQLTGGGDAGGAGGLGIPFAVPGVSQLLGGQDLSGLAGQDLSFTGQSYDTSAQYF
ncbi:hypothetical protein V7S43_002185 [Phytophthora oleae]|uniref:C2 domain-containing protein n=1 Tax=Phytophthora oleae TaxID=2107226 RepID=A0ABD3G1B5_9STRA